MDYSSMLHSPSLALVVGTRVMTGEFLGRAKFICDS
jgi:hypothetical protein